MKSIHLKLPTQIFNELTQLKIDANKEAGSFLTWEAFFLLKARK